MLTSTNYLFSPFIIEEIGSFGPEAELFMNQYCNEHPYSKINLQSAIITDHST